MTDHQNLAAPFAVHPFAFVQATDPALDPSNFVTAYKAWIDTSSGNALKVRNGSNTGWEIIVAGGGGASAQFTLRGPAVVDLVKFPNPENVLRTPTQITYI